MQKMTKNMEYQKLKYFNAMSIKDRNHKQKDIPQENRLIFSDVIKVVSLELHLMVRILVKYICTDLIMFHVAIIKYLFYSYLFN